VCSALVVCLLDFRIFQHGACAVLDLSLALEGIAMDQIASFVVFMLAAMAISLSVLVAVVFCIGLCEGASWMWTRFHLSPVTHRHSSLISR